MDVSYPLKSPPGRRPQSVGYVFLVNCSSMTAVERIGLGFLLRRFGRMDDNEAMPDHGVFSRIGDAVGVGARGWPPIPDEQMPAIAG